VDEYGIYLHRFSTYVFPYAVLCHYYNPSESGEHFYQINETPAVLSEIEPMLLAELKNTHSAFVMLRFDNTLEIQDMVNLLTVDNRLYVKMIRATTRTRNG